MAKSAQITSISTVQPAKAVLLTGSCEVTFSYTAVSMLSGYPGPLDVAE